MFLLFELFSHAGYDLSEKIFTAFIVVIMSPYLLQHFSYLFNFCDLCNSSRELPGTLTGARYNAVAPIIVVLVTVGFL